MTSRAQQKRGAPRSTEKTNAEKRAETDRQLATIRRDLEAHAQALAASLDASGEVATKVLSERLEPLKMRLRELLGPARAMDMAIQRSEDARAGLEVPGDAATLLDAMIEAEPFGSAYEPGIEWAAADPDTIERAAIDLFDDLRRQCDAVSAAIRKAEGEAKAAYDKAVKPVREQQMPACVAASTRVAQVVRNRTAARLGRPLPFVGLGTAAEVYAAAKKALDVPINLVDLVTKAIGEIDIQAPTSPADAIDDDILPD